MVIETNVSNVVGYQWAFWDVADDLGSSDYTLDCSGTPAGGPGFSVWAESGVACEQGTKFRWKN